MSFCKSGNWERKKINIPGLFQKRLFQDHFERQPIYNPYVEKGLPVGVPPQVYF